MKIVKFKHEGVKPDGTFYDGLGCVMVDGGINVSQPEGGCDIKTCTCSEGHWICIVAPRTDDGVVEGITVHFDDAAEMHEYFQLTKCEYKLNN